MTKEDRILELKDIIIENSAVFPEYTAEKIVKFFVEETGLSREDKGEIIEFYSSALKTMNHVNIFEKQVSYAIKLMALDRKLIYEEVHKLFSLFDNIYCLYLLGYSIENTDLIEYEELKGRFVLNKEVKISKLVSEDKYEDWKKYWWWYM